MTSPGAGGPLTALDVLFGTEADIPAALGREILSASGQDLGRVLGRLPEATREAAVREAATVAAGLLQVDLISVLVTGWREHRDIISAARRTLAAPGSTELVSMITHQVTVAQNPSVSVLVDGHRVAAVQLGLSIAFDVNALLVGISGGPAELGRQRSQQRAGICRGPAGERRGGVPDRPGQRHGADADPVGQSGRRRGHRQVRRAEPRHDGRGDRH